MSRECQITGKSVMSGNKVSKSNRKTRRTFAPNLTRKRFFDPETGKWVTLKVSAAALRTINKNGFSATVRKAMAEGRI